MSHTQLLEYLNSCFSMLGSTGAEERGHEAKDREQQLVVAVRYTGDEPTILHRGGLAGHTGGDVGDTRFHGNILIARVHVDELAFGNVHECVSGEQFSRSEVVGGNS